VLKKHVVIPFETDPGLTVRFTMPYKYVSKQLVCRY